MNNSWLNGIFPVFRESKQGFGEDSFCYSFFDKAGLMAVLDGCGGLGSRRYEKHGGFTGAYIASRLVSEVLLKWYTQYGPSIDNEQSISQLNVELQNCLQEAKKALEAGAGIIMLGSMVRTLPTTLCGAMVEHDSGTSIKARFFGAGDSRGFLLSSEGLRQITRDDLVGSPDAMENLFSDAPMSKTVNADQPIRLSDTRIDFQMPAILITATDGAFGYFASPMDFEFFLLSTLRRAGSLAQWQQGMDQALAKTASDDYSLLLVPCGYTSFKQLRLSLQKRFHVLNNRYIKPMNACQPRNREQMFELWGQYQADYYGGQETHE